MLMLPVAVLGWLGLRKTGLGFSRVLWLVLGWFVMILPATLHNLKVGKDFVLVNSNSGYTFYQGNNRIAVGTIVSPPEVNEQAFNGRFLTSIADQQTFDLDYASLHLKPPGPGQKLELVKPSQASGFWLHQGLSFIARRPGQYLGLEFQKLVLLLSNHEFPSNYYLDVEQNELPFLRVLFVPFALILALAVLGIVATVRDARRDKSRGRGSGVGGQGTPNPEPRSPSPDPWSMSWPLFLVIGSTALTLLVFYVGMRYRLPLVLPLAVFAGGGLTRLIEGRRRRRVILPELAITVVPLVISGLLCTIPLNRRLAYTTAQGYRNLGQVWDDQARNPARAEQMYDKALSIFTSFKTFGRTPLSAGTRSELLYLRGNAFMDQQKYDSAVRDFKNARQANPRMDVVLPKLASAYLRRALAQRNQSPAASRQQLDTALAYARDWHARDSLAPGASVLLGDVFAAQGDTALAEQAYRAAIRLDSTQTPAWIALGDISLGRGDTAGAIDAYTRASRQDTLNLLPAIKLGTAYGRMGNHLQAQAVFGTMLARLERRPNARQAILHSQNAANYLYLKYLLGAAYLGEREWDKAAEQAQEILGIAPDYRPARELLTQAQQHRIPE
jgi:tetratricopeptide (TPR) repeat protein